MKNLKMVHYFVIFGLMIFMGWTKTDGTEISNNSSKPLYLNPNASVDDRVKDLMSKMTLDEKVYQMCQYVGLEHMKAAEKDLTQEELDKNDARGFYPGLLSKDVARMTTEGKIGSFLHVITAEEANHLQELALKSRLKIPVLIGIDAIHGNALVNGTTVYPSPITQASTWDENLMETASKQTAIEMRATGSHWSFTPNIDVLRDPRWGRTGETFGEDPFLVGNMGVATIKGLQSSDFSGTDHVIACAKHLIAGSQSINGLNASPTDISKRTLFEIFLPPYRRAIEEANVYSIMAAHNEVNGVPAHMDKYMMTELLRNRWGFKGFYVSDWNDVSRIDTWHHVANNFKEASYLAVEAGLDMHMHGPLFADYIIELVKEGKLPEARINEACSKILEAKFKLGLFENPFVDLSKVDASIFTESHKQTALEQARKGIVLQKNNRFLPLGTGSGKSILVLGPNANNQTTLGDWASPQPDENVVTAFEGIQNIGEANGYKVSLFETAHRSKDISDNEIAGAADEAAKSDIVVLVLGENSFRHDWPNKTTGENIDRATLQLSGRQLVLANAVLAQNKNVIVVYISGSPIAEPELENNVQAVINAWEPGSLGGQAIAEIIFGKVNPSGKLPVTVPRSVGQLQMVYNHKPTAYIHKYNTEKKVPLHPFGFGLSYTTFEISKPILSTSEVKSASDKVEATVTVTNTGKMEGEEVIQLYIRDNVSSFTRPVKELKAYKRVHLKPGESKSVSLEITPQSLAFYDKDFNFIVEPGEFTVMTGNSSEDKSLQKTTLSVPSLIKLKD